MALTQKQTSLIHFVATFISVFLTILSISVVFWVHQTSDNDDNYYGIFMRESSDKDVTSACNSAMTEIECGYLKSAKACGVISIMFGGASCGMYLVTGGAPGFGFYSFSMGLVGLIQTMFGMMCVVIFSYFKESYLTLNDDLNVEYPTHPDSTYSWAFYILITSVVISFVSSLAYIFVLYKPSLVKRSSSEERLFNAYEA
jgi:uncharacterized membrane protein